MPFFNELGKKITQVSQNAIQKTKDVTDTVKLNSAISEEERNIERRYSEIGKLYASLHAADYEKAFEPMMRSIRESEERIAGHRRQVQDIKGFVPCPNCGVEVPADAAFCNGCGAPMPKRPAVSESVDPNMTKCPNCGALVSKEMRFCTSCGNPLPEKTEQEPEVSQEQPVEESVKKCSHCGAECPEGTIFCMNCGEKISE